MPLSEQEQRLLEEMERNLYHNEADFVATVAPRRGRVSYSVLVIGILVGVLGVAALVTGVIVRQPLVGLLGFIIMFAGVLIAVTPPRRTNGAAPRPSGGRPAGTPSTFMSNLNDRWDKRQDERGR